MVFLFNQLSLIKILIGLFLVASHGELYTRVESLQQFDYHARPVVLHCTGGGATVVSETLFKRHLAPQQASLERQTVEDCKCIHQVDGPLYQFGQPQITINYCFMICTPYHQINLIVLLCFHYQKHLYPSVGMHSLDNAGLLNTDCSQLTTMSMTLIF